MLHIQTQIHLQTRTNKIQTNLQNSKQSTYKTTNKHLLTTCRHACQKLIPILQLQKNTNSTYIKYQLTFTKRQIMSKISKHTSKPQTNTHSNKRWCMSKACTHITNDKEIHVKTCTPPSKLQTVLTCRKRVPS